MALLGPAGREKGLIVIGYQWPSIYKRLQNKHHCFLVIYVSIICDIQVIIQLCNEKQFNRICPFCAFDGIQIFLFLNLHFPLFIQNRKSVNVLVKHMKRTILYFKCKTLRNLSNPSNEFAICEMLFKISFRSKRNF